MQGTHAVVVARVEPTHDIPPRFPEGGIVELVEAMGGEVGEGEDIDAALRRTLSALPFAEMAETLLELVLLQPPIPAYCESLVRAMQDPERPPWRDHDVAEDRFSLWYAHRLLHRALPEQWPAPVATHLVLDVVALTADATLPGPRTAPHDRTAFLARLLHARPDGGPWSKLGDDEQAWAYDVLWAVEVAPRRSASDELAARAGAPAGAPSARIEAWMPPGWTDELSAGAVWTVHEAPR